METSRYSSSSEALTHACMHAHTHTCAGFTALWI